MSRHHYAQTFDTHGILRDITVLPKNELEQRYGIEVLDDKSVFDPVSGRNFTTLQEWAEVQIQEESWAEAEHTHANSRKFDNEF